MAKAQRLTPEMIIERRIADGDLPSVPVIMAHARRFYIMEDGRAPDADDGANQAPEKFPWDALNDHVLDECGQSIEQILKTTDEGLPPVSLILIYARLFDIENGSMPPDKTNNALAAPAGLPWPILDQYVQKQRGKSIAEILEDKNAGYPPVQEIVDDAYIYHRNSLNLLADSTKPGPYDFPWNALTKFVSRKTNKSLNYHVKKKIDQRIEGLEEELTEEPQQPKKPNRQKTEEPINIEPELAEFFRPGLGIPTSRTPAFKTERPAKTRTTPVTPAVAPPPHKPARTSIPGGPSVFKAAAAVTTSAAAAPANPGKTVQTPEETRSTRPKAKPLRAKPLRDEQKAAAAAETSLPTEAKATDVATTDEEAPKAKAKKKTKKKTSRRRATPAKTAPKGETSQAMDRARVRAPAEPKQDKPRETKTQAPKTKENVVKTIAAHIKAEGNFPTFESGEIKHGPLAGGSKNWGSLDFEMSLGFIEGIPAGTTLRTAPQDLAAELKAEGVTPPVAKNDLEP